MRAFSTHEVHNQAPPLEDYSLYDTDPVLRQAVQREGALAWQPQLREHAAWLGRATTFAAGEQANRHSPELQTYDAQGHRVDRVVFHPAWRFLMDGMIARGLHCGAWDAQAPGAHVARAAGYVMQGQIEAGVLCPATMTFAAIPLLQAEPAGELDFSRDWLPRLRSRHFDDSDAPIMGKRGALVGMGLTEKQGGSDLRAVATRAEAVGQPGRGRAYLLTGHKWFYSVPQADAHLVLARGESGLACYCVPRWMPDGTRNAVRIRQLKDKLGNRSNASAEVEFEQAWGMQLGESGQGLRILLSMAATTRLDCVLGSAALLRQALAQAIHHAARRQAFGQALVCQPVMRRLLTDLALESEAACVLSLRLARAMDQHDQEEGARALLRAGTPAAKFWICRRVVAAVAECLEVWGGNGYVETGPMARLYREAPVNAIWEGSSNVMALDVQRALHAPGVLPALEAELASARGAQAPYDQALRQWLDLASRQDAQATEADARVLAAGLARLWQAALLIQHAPAPVAQAFVATRIAQVSGVYGEYAFDAQTISAVLQRAWPDTY